MTVFTFRTVLAILCFGVCASACDAAEESGDSDPAATAGAPVAKPASAFAPCDKPPPGTVCVPGGSFVVGSNENARNERPQRTIELSTFYIDRHEITIGDYAACEDAGACLPRLKKKSRLYRPFLGEQQPVVPMDWYRAQQYCAWAGKRLPTEWEWEAAARGPAGETYPWGNDAPTCDRAVYRECAPKGCKPYPGFRHPWDCSVHTTQVVGTFPPGRYGIFEMAGNGYEWTASWASSVDRCGSRCEGRDPRGPCDGANPCKGYRAKVLKGGSWYWPAEQMRASYRRFSPPDTGSHRLSARCATSKPYLTSLPPRLLTEERIATTLTPPTQEQLDILGTVREDPIDNKKECKLKGRSLLACRDPMHYVFTNEPLRHQWHPYIRDLGGGFVGIGSEGNYTLVAVARSQWAWLVDYDIVVVMFHRVLQALVPAAPTRHELVQLFSPRLARRAHELLIAAYPDRAEQVAVRQVYRTQRARFFKHFRFRLRSKRGDGADWIGNDKSYSYIRAMFEQGRIRVVRGDLLMDGAMTSIGQVARALNIAVRVYFPSNAPEMWPLTPQYRSNVRGLPFDDSSVVLQTFSGRAIGTTQIGSWQYNIQHGLQHQELLGRNGYTRAKQLIDGALPTGKERLSAKGLPGGAGPIRTASKDP